MVKVGDKIKAYPMRIGGEIVKKFGPIKTGTVVEVWEPGWHGNIYGKRKSFIIEKDDGTREDISERQLYEEK